jgi:hypothetical protein
MEIVFANGVSSTITQVNSICMVEKGVLMVQGTDGGNQIFERFTFDYN